mmetsp:Transcript_18594/g.30579  ORF Transcript_18594/g.30579 Transcript_18594/m.30579 type:complete len:506 (-) Transcript_18594:584-2101(-)
MTRLSFPMFTFIQCIPNCLRDKDDVLDGKSDLLRKLEAAVSADPIFESQIENFFHNYYSRHGRDPKDPFRLLASASETDVPDLVTPFYSDSCFSSLSSQVSLKDSDSLLDEASSASNRTTPTKSQPEKRNVSSLTQPAQNTGRDFSPLSARCDSPLTGAITLFNSVHDSPQEPFASPVHVTSFSLKTFSCETSWKVTSEEEGGEDDETLSTSSSSKSSSDSSDDCVQAKLAAVLPHCLFARALQDGFKGGPSVPVETFLASLKRKLAAIGFDNKNAAIVLNICDEPSMKGFADEVREFWSDQSSSSKGASAFCLVTGPGGFVKESSASLLRAAQRFRVRKLVFVYITHIAVNDEGQWGVSTDLNAKELSGCRVLDWVLDNRSSTKSSLKRDQSPFKSHHKPCSSTQAKSIKKALNDTLFPADKHTPSLAEVTLKACRLVMAKATKKISEVCSLRRIEYAICSGILVHGPRGQDYIHPVAFTSSQSASRKHLMQSTSLSDIKGKSS